MLQPVEDDVDPVVLVPPRMPVVPEVEPVELDPDDELPPDDPDDDAVCARTGIAHRAKALIARNAVKDRMVSPFVLLVEAIAPGMVSGDLDTVT